MCRHLSGIAAFPACFPAYSFNAAFLSASLFGDLGFIDKEFIKKL